MKGCDNKKLSFVFFTSYWQSAWRRHTKAVQPCNQRPAGARPFVFWRMQLWEMEDGRVFATALAVTKNRKSTACPVFAVSLTMVLVYAIVMAVVLNNLCAQMLVRTLALREAMSIRHTLAH